MAGQFDLKVESTTNPCCISWEDRFIKLQQKVKKTEDARAALKKAVAIYEQQFDKMQNEKLNLKKAYEDEKLQADHERKEKEKESAARVSMENEISTLKAEILSLSQKRGSVSENANEELLLLKGRVLDKEKEIKCIQEEKKKTESEKSRTEQELSNLKTRLVNVETEKKKLMQDLQKERAKRADEIMVDKKNDDLCLLKSEKQNLETEVIRLKEVVENERKRADCEAKKAKTEKKNAHKAKEMLSVEQSKVNEKSINEQDLSNLKNQLVKVETEKKTLMQDLQKERKKTEEFAEQLQQLKCESDEAKSKLVSEGLKVKSVNKKFEAEKKKSIKEKKKAEEQQKIAEMSTKHALEEKQNAVRLQQQLEDCQNKYNKLKKDMANYETNTKTHQQVKKKTDLDMVKETENNKKVAEMYKLEALREKARADKLTQELEDTKKLSKNKHKVNQDLVSTKDLTDAMKVRSSEMKLLKKRLKLEKARVKHFNQVAELEKKCKKAVEDELNRLKLEFARFSSRVGLCNCFDYRNVGKSCLEKNGKEPAKATKPSEYSKPNLDISTPSIPISGTCTESTSGTELLCNRKYLDSLALVSSMSSFSDRQLVVGPQDNNIPLQLPISRLSSENAEVADNNVKSPLKVKNNTKKRKRLHNAIESIEHLYTEGKTKIAKNVSELHGMLVHNNIGVAMEKTRDDDLENFKKMFNGDCMKLLDFDSEVEEERYRAAVERPLSPTLPNIEFESSLIDLEDSRPSIESWSVIVSSEIRDSGSISKILHMTKTFNGRCCSFSQSDLVVKNVISTLSADEILSSKEKVCVFFSLFLKSFSSIEMINSNHVNDGTFLSILHMISGKLKKVMSDVETRTKFAKLFDLEELLTLVQDFLIKQEILVCSTDTSSDTRSLPESKASLHELVLGAVFLASVCESFDRVDFICETSYSISQTTSSLTLTLTLLHVFAYVCDEKLLHHDDYILIMTVIKSLVTCCEMENLSSGFPSCATCPFSTGAVSMEELASLLLKKLSDYLIRVSGMMSFKSSVVPDDTLTDLGNVLSLLELLATKMSWGWVCENIVSELLKMLEVCVTEAPLTSIFVLLGQMARLGIDANGYQDAEVEGIRVKLISFISQSTTNKVSLPVQFGAVTALLGTTPLSFQEICKNSLELPPPVMYATATDCIQRWFSLLSDEHKSLSVRLFNC